MKKRLIFHTLFFAGLACAASTFVSASQSSDKDNLQAENTLVPSASGSAAPSREHQQETLLQTPPNHKECANPSHYSSGVGYQRFSRPQRPGIPAPFEGYKAPGDRFQEPKK